MFDSPTKLKNFIVWCKENKVKNFKFKDVEFELSELAFVEDIKAVNLEEGLKEMNLDSTKDILSTDPDLNKEDDDLLYWSSNS